MILTPFPLIKNSPEPKTNQESSQNSLRHLAGVPPRQALQTKPRNWVTTHASPGGQDCAARRFLFRNLEM